MIAPLATPDELDGLDPVDDEPTPLHPDHAPVADRPRPEPRPRSEADVAAAIADDHLIDGLLRRGRLLVLAGAEGVGKSTVELEMKIRLATGHGALFNHYAIRDRYRVLSIDVENGDDEETRREEDALHTMGLERADLVDYWGVSLEGLSLVAEADQAYVRDAVQRIQPDVVFFDTGSSMVGEEWGAELKLAIRFLRGLSIDYGAAVVVAVHLVKPAKSTGKAKGKPEAQHGTVLADVMGQWTRQADVVALMADQGADRRLWTVRKRAPHHQLVLRMVDGTYDAVQVTGGEDIGVLTTERIHGCIATGYATAAAIAEYLAITERTVWRHVSKLRDAGRVAPDAPLRVSEAVSPRVSGRPRTNGHAPSVPVSDVSAGRTDTVTPPVGGDSVSVSVDDVGGFAL